jgi:iron complex outermembrane receptor protein
MLGIAGEARPLGLKFSVFSYHLVTIETASRLGGTARPEANLGDRFMTTRNSLLRSTILTGLAGLVLFGTPGLALAQESKPAAEATNAKEAAQDVEELVVTGSRIRRTEFTSASPIQVISVEQARLVGISDTGTLLQKSSLAAGSFQVNGLLTGYVTNGGPGINTVGLRGLGSERTLVLVNGRRPGPAGVRGTVGAVDLNTIPESVLDRVEILKDGGSSIYGSDAIGGVINLITKKSIDGGYIETQYRSPTRAGGERVNVSGVWGKTFDKGYITVTGDYRKQFILTSGDRDETACAQAYLFDPSTGQRVDYIDSLTGRTKCNNLLSNVAIVGGFGGYFQYPVDGQTYPTAAQGNNAQALFPGTPFIRSGRAGRPIMFPYANLDSPLTRRTSVFNPLETITVFASGSYDLTPKTEAYGEILINQRKSEQQGVRQLFPTIPDYNPGFAFSGAPYAIPVIAVTSDGSQTVDFGRFQGGIKGTIDSLPWGKNWNWDVFGQYSHSSGDYENDFIYSDRLDAVTQSDIPCDESLITQSKPVQCVNFNWFSKAILEGNFSPEQRAFLFGRAKGRTIYEQTTFEASANGDLFKLPAGMVGAAVGVSWRRDKIDDNPSDPEKNGNFWGSSSAGRTQGEDTVKEVFGELSVPLVKGVPLIQGLSLSASGRYTDYDSFGAESTYKVGLDWKISSAFRVRSTVGTSFRAPALFELYLADQTGFLDQLSIDPCINYGLSDNTRLQANCAAVGLAPDYTSNAASATIFSGGGKGKLTAETADTKSLSLVWTPSFTDLSVAIDYLDIEITNQIDRFGAYNIVSQCYTSAQFATEPFCKFFTRETNPNSPDYQGITEVRDDFLNIISVKNRAIDYTVNYKHRFTAGALTLEAKATQQIENGSKLLGESKFKDYNGSTNNNDFVGQVTARFDRDDWTYTWQYEFFSKASDSGAPDALADIRLSSTYGDLTGPRRVYYKQYTEFTGFHTAAIRYEKDKWHFGAGVRNLFDEKAPALSSGGFRRGTAALNQYDDGILGRSIFVSIDRKF